MLTLKNDFSMPLDDYYFFSDSFFYSLGKEMVEVSHQTLAG